MLRKAVPSWKFPAELPSLLFEALDKIGERRHCSPCRLIWRAETLAQASWLNTHMTITAAGSKRSCQP